MAGFASGTPRPTDHADDKRADDKRAAGNSGAAVGKTTPSGHEKPPSADSLTVVLEKLREAAAAHDGDC